MLIRNVRSEPGYTVIENECFLDARVTSEALGMLCYIASKPDAAPADLAKRFRVDSGTVHQILGELTALGYLSAGAAAS